MARLLLKPVTLAFFALFFLRPIPAQQIMVKLVDGRTGRALRNQYVEIWLAEKPFGTPTQALRTNTEGIALVPVPAQPSSFVAGGKSLVDCRVRMRYTASAAMNDYGSYQDEVYRFADVLAHGAVGANKCGKATAEAIPGQLVLFVRPPHWWERAMWE
jgi:hypothetical protein